MSAERDRVRELASRIAERVSQGEGRGDNARSPIKSDELDSVRRSIAELKQKLASIEEHLSDDGVESGRENSHAARPPSSAHSPWLSGIYVPATHPSQERFGVEEAAISELVDFFEKEKVCELEPGGKPCTHCDMCSTRGF